MSDSIALLRQTLPAVLPRLRRFARTLAHNVPDADDLAQNTIERALARAAQWRAPAADASSGQVGSGSQELDVRHHEEHMDR